MNETAALALMVPPASPRKSAWMQGIIQVWVTRACDKACYHCTQGSNLRASQHRDEMYITLENFEIAVKSLRNYFGVVGIFGGNPALHPQFEEICSILAKHIPFNRRGLWCNNPFKHAKLMRETFNPQVSNLNVHLDTAAYNAFKEGWPESQPFGLIADSFHSPVHGSMKYVVQDEAERWNLIADCDINKYWSAMIGQFRGQARGWFCEVAGAQAMLHQHKVGYPDTGIPIICPDCTVNWPECPTCNGRQWWEHSMSYYAHQVRQHCHNCLVPLKAKGVLACSTTESEITTPDMLELYMPKKLTRSVTHKIEPNKIKVSTDYLGNAR